MQVNKKEYSTTEVAKLLKVSRIAVFNKIKSGQLKARKIGRNYVIDQIDLDEVTGMGNESGLTDQGKRRIEKSVEKTIKEYGETLELLGKEDNRQ